MNIVLIGYRGAGKSTVGRELAIRLGKIFLDTDGIIEARQSASINDIVQTYGWVHFRALEKSIIEKVSQKDNLIIAAGGGAVLDRENVIGLKKKGLMIWLKADPTILYKRIYQDPNTAVRRPTLTGKGTMEEFHEVLASRISFYEEAADIQLDTSNLELEDVVQKVLSVIQEKRGDGNWAGIHSERSSG